MNTLDSLADTAKNAAAAYERLERSTVEARREQVMVFGRALNGIRKQFKSDQKFGGYLVAHHLDFQNKTWRADAMWLAREVDGLRISVTHCPNSNPIDIRKWVRKQDPNYVPKKRTTTAGNSESAQKVRDFVRDKVEHDEPINVQEVCKAVGHSRIVVEAAIAAERARKEALDTAPVDVIRIAEVLGLSKSAKDHLAALDRRLRRQYEMTFDARVSAGVRKYVQEVILPEYNAQMTEADERLASGKPPLTPAEYQTLQFALHEDQTTPERRAEGFDILHRLRNILRGVVKGEHKPRSLPSTLDELLARRRKPGRAA